VLDHLVGLLLRALIAQVTGANPLQVQFVDRRWERRFGRAPSPIEPEARADQFFRNNSDDLYAIIDADLSELQEALS